MSSHLLPPQLPNRRVHWTYTATSFSTLLPTSSLSCLPLALTTRPFFQSCGTYANSPLMAHVPHATHLPPMAASSAFYTSNSKTHGRKPSRIVTQGLLAACSSSACLYENALHLPKLLFKETGRLGNCHVCDPLSCTTSLSLVRFHTDICGMSR